MKKTRLQLENNLPFRTAYSPRLRVALSFAGEGKTKQSFKEECDINVIMSRYQQTGRLPDQLNPANPQYIDATGFDFDLAMNLVAEATSAFAELPSDIRSQFGNDPGAFLDFVADPENRSQLASMGLTSELPEWASGHAATPTSESPTSPSTPLQNDSPSTTGSNSP